MTNFQLLRRAEQLAKAEGGSWAGKLEQAQRELDREIAASRKPSTPHYPDELVRKAVIAQVRHQQPGVGNPDPDRRIEVGEVKTEVGRVRVAVSRDSLMVHGANVMLQEIDADLRSAIISTAAGLDAAETDIEQTKQREIIGFLVSAVLRRHQQLAANVRSAQHKERYGV